MKKIYLLSLLTLSYTVSFGQDYLSKVADSIVNEGKIMYRSEWASWYGTDIFLDQCKSKKDQFGGYLSYETDKGLTNIFFSTGPEPLVLATTTFGPEMDQKKYSLDTVNRKLKKNEKALYDLRQIALKRIEIDTIFQQFKNASLNVIPIIEKKVKRVYVLTGPKVNGVVIFGNDYLLNFNDENEITSIKRLHKNIITIQYRNALDSDKQDVATIHTHVPESGDLITATDICTLMLYEKFAHWDQHYVVSKNDVCIWDCKKDTLVTLTMEAWNKMNEEQKNHPQKDK
jgi:hypothetical protein